MCHTLDDPAAMTPSERRHEVANILAREKHPEWQGERTKMVYAFPSSETLWARYADLRADSLAGDGDGRETPGATPSHGLRICASIP